QDSQTHGLDLPLGTLTDGLQRLLPLFGPLYEKLIAHNQAQAHWHADETRWLALATAEGEVGHRWFLWVCPSGQAVLLGVDSGRACNRWPRPPRRSWPIRASIRRARRCWRVCKSTGKD